MSGGLGGVRGVYGFRGFSGVRGIWWLGVQEFRGWAWGPLRLGFRFRAQRLEHPQLS